jgi:peptide deformylase
MKMPEYKDTLPNFAMNNLVKRLKLTMKLYGGIGLSANQCGIFERVFVIGTDQFQIACINPKVIKSSADLQKENEGCLSFPGLYVKIARPSWN